MSHRESEEVNSVIYLRSEDDARRANLPMLTCIVLSKLMRQTKCLLSQNKKIFMEKVTPKRFRVIK